MAEETAAAEQAQAEALGHTLRDREKLFVREYLRDLNATAAAIRAGYSEKTAASQASRLLRRPGVRAYRDALLQEQFEAIGVNRHSIATEVWSVYQKCCQKEPVLEWDREAKAWVPNGQWQFDVRGALKALDLLRQMVGEMDKTGEDDPGESLEALIGGGGGREF